MIAFLIGLILIIAIVFGMLASPTFRKASAIVFAVGGGLVLLVMLLAMIAQ